MAAEMNGVRVKEIFTNLATNIEKAVIGKEQSVFFTIIALFSGGHILVEDVPGTGKTLLAKSLAASVGVDFKRIQFTPDLLPSDITGINYFNMKKSEFEFMKGPVFANILLADEINRATPKTQAGLLECMEERQVTVDGVTHLLNNPFMVIATQNPAETQGVFPLPEAQLDRFTLKISMNYTSRSQTVEMMERHRTGKVLQSLSTVASSEDITSVQDFVPRVAVVRDLMEYIARLAEATRMDEGVVLGVSPRACLSLMRVSQTIAAVNGRDFVIPDDIKSAAVPVLAHRLILKGTERIKKGAAEGVINRILQNSVVPTEIIN